MVARSFAAILIVDGRQPNYSEGVTLPELAQIAIEYGADTAFNLDGGGSSSLVVEDRQGRLQVLNSPIHPSIPGMEKPVGNHLGVWVQSNRWATDMLSCYPFIRCASVASQEGIMGISANAPHHQLTYRIIGLAMEVHNDLGPGHREADYHDALHIKFKSAGLNFLDEPKILITLDSGEVVKARRPDFVVEECLIVELKGRTHLMTKDDQAQVIGYFAALKQCPVALFFNFGRPRLEYHRLFPPKKVVAFQRQKWGKPAE